MSMKKRPTHSTAAAVLSSSLYLMITDAACHWWRCWPLWHWGVASPPTPPGQVSVDGSEYSRGAPRKHWGPPCHLYHAPHRGWQELCKNCGVVGKNQQAAAQLPAVIDNQVDPLVKSLSSVLHHVEKLQLRDLGYFLLSMCYHTWELLGVQGYCCVSKNGSASSQHQLLSCRRCIGFCRLSLAITQNSVVQSLLSKFCFRDVWWCGLAWKFRRRILWNKKAHRPRSTHTGRCNDVSKQFSFPEQTQGKAVIRTNIAAE